MTHRPALPTRLINPLYRAARDARATPLCPHGTAPGPSNGDRGNARTSGPPRPPSSTPAEESIDMSNLSPASYPPRRCARPGIPALLAACLATLLAGASAPALAQPVALDAAATAQAAVALDDREMGLWRAAYLRVARLADEGDAGAARLALRMRDAVTRFFGTTLQVTPAQLRRWAAVVAQDDWANCDAPSTETLQLLQG